MQNLEDEETARIAKPWLETPIDLKKVKRVLSKSALVISDNDPYDCYKENVEKFKQLGSKIVTLHNAGHISESDGFTELPQVLEILEKFGA